MSDINSFLDSLEAPPETVEPVGAPEATPEPAEAAPAESSGVDALPAWAQKEIRDARKEAQSLRERAKPFAEVFDGYADDDREVLLTLARLVKEDPTQGASYARQIADVLEGLTPAEAKAEIAEATAEAGSGLTEERLLQILEEREAKREREAQVLSIEQEAKALGYEPNSKSYVELLWIANNQTKGDIAKAHEQITAERQKIIDDYLAQKANETSTASPNAGTAPSSERKISNLNDSKSALNDYLNATFGAKR